MRQRQALSVMLDGANIFLTGPPGAGKTYVLNEFIRRARARGKTVAVTASTGIAATHLNGTTIHSWSGLGIRDRLTHYDLQWLSSNDRLRKRYNAIDVLVIDEVSMLHGARLDMVNEACKLLRDSQEPFGGLQVILVGDLFQLPPVSPGSRDFDFVHLSQAWQELNPRICYLSEQHRQVGDGLLELLTAMRDGELDQMHHEQLQKRLGKSIPADQVVTRLFTHNIDVETINQRHLDKLASDSRTYSMATKGSKSSVEQLRKSVLAPEVLTVKIGAEVMFVANNFAEGFVNGTRGKVIGFSSGLPEVQLHGNERIIVVEAHSWSLQEDGRTRAEVTQLPLRLAWAITIHKSQGMSLDAAEIDLSRAFTPGMGYVALSRVRSLEGIYLQGLNRQALQLQPIIYEFDRLLRQASTLLAENTADAPDEVVEPEMAEAEVAIDEPLFQKLRAWRLERARADKVAPFIVAHDIALAELSVRKPKTLQQLSGVKGFGPKKVASYGEDILRVIASYGASV